MDTCILVSGGFQLRCGMGQQYSRHHAYLFESVCMHVSIYMYTYIYILIQMYISGGLHLERGVGSFVSSSYAVLWRRCVPSASSSAQGRGARLAATTSSYCAWKAAVSCRRHNIHAHTRSMHSLTLKVHMPFCNRSICPICASFWNHDDKCLSSSSIGFMWWGAAYWMHVVRCSILNAWWYLVHSDCHGYHSFMVYIDNASNVWLCLWRYHTTMVSIHHHKHNELVNLTWYPWCPAIIKLTAPAYLIHSYADLM